MAENALNTTDHPVVIDAEGRILAGGDSAEVDETTPEVQSAVALGWLVLRGAPTPPHIVEDIAPVQEDPVPAVEVMSGEIVPAGTANTPPVTSEIAAPNVEDVPPVNSSTTISPLGGNG